MKEKGSRIFTIVSLVWGWNAGGLIAGILNWEGLAVLGFMILGALIGSGICFTIKEERGTFLGIASFMIVPVAMYIIGYIFTFAVWVINLLLGLVGIMGFGNVVLIGLLVAAIIWVFSHCTWIFFF